MKLIDLYPFIGTKSEFLDKYDKPESQEIAEKFWDSLSSSCVFFIIFLIVVSFFGCFYYFTAYNEQPGRHYKRTHWIGAYAITVLLVFIGTVILGYLLTNPTLNGSEFLIWYISLSNLLYSFILFGLLSCVWFMWLPTNAYRLIGNK